MADPEKQNPVEGDVEVDEGLEEEEEQTGQTNNQPPQLPLDLDLVKVKELSYFYLNIDSFDGRLNSHLVTIEGYS